MKKIVNILLVCFTILLFSGCTRRGFFNTTATEDALLIGGAVVLSPILLPYTLIKEANQDALEKKIHQEYIDGIANSDFEIMKKCIKNKCYIREGLYLEASKKLVEFDRECLTADDYATYIRAYFYIIKDRVDAKEIVDKDTIEKAKTLYQNSEKIYYDRNNNSSCVSVEEFKLKDSLQKELPYILKKNIIRELKAYLFLTTLQEFEDVEQEFTNCPSIIHNEWPNLDYYNSFSHHYSSICRIAYDAYQDIYRDSSDSFEEYSKKREEYIKIWNEWGDNFKK